MTPFGDYVELAARVMEGAGVLVMILGALVSLLLLARVGWSAGAAFRSFRQNLGRAILLGLEFLVAADIIRTVSEVPSLNKVLVLAMIVLIRTFLSFTLEVELEGRWPWQARQQHERAPGVGSPSSSPPGD